MKIPNDVLDREFQSSMEKNKKDGITKLNKFVNAKGKVDVTKSYKESIDRVLDKYLSEEEKKWAKCGGKGEDEKCTKCGKDCKCDEGRLVCPKCGKPQKENTEGNKKYCQGHSNFDKKEKK